MTRDEVERGLTEIVQQVNGTDPALATTTIFAADTSLYDELNVDSLAMVELAEAVEERYGVTTNEDHLHELKTFGDAVDYVDSLLR
jgi:acyl carrier protein